MNAFVGTALTEHIAFSPEHYLICRSVPISRIGWQIYRGGEISPELDANRMYRVWRDESQVFDQAAMASAEGKACTRTHPPTMLSADNTSSFQRGHMQNIRRDGDFLVADLVITCPLLAEEILSGRLREVSCGYTCRYVPLGENEFSQENIRVNHCALVESARAGSEVAIQDAAEENMDTKELKAELGRAIALCEEVIAKRGGERAGSRMIPSSDALAHYDAQTKAGQEYSDACKAAGEAMGAKLLAGLVKS